ncbi:Ig-like domain-containing protein [Pollutibacter soli]|uniref:Ig-like domain-containing protein n=1 Tax=Pollutibacter soli TaxID=3034157 RepID=UPI003013D983
MVNLSKKSSLIFFLFLIANACSKDPGKDPDPRPAQRVVSTVRIEPVNPTIEIGDSIQLKAIVLDQNNKEMVGQSIQWISSDAAVVRISDPGLAIGLKEGNATISASSSGKTGTTVVQAKLNTVAVVTIEPDSLNILTGEAAELKVKLFSKYNTLLTGRAVTFISSDSGRLTVDAKGNIKAIAAGDITVTATAEGKSAKCNVKVRDIPVDKIDLNGLSAQLYVGSSLQLTPTLKDAQNNILTGRIIAWSSSDTSVIGVNQTGLVTAIKEGQAEITANAEGKTKTAKITSVKVPVGTITVSPAIVKIQTGATIQLQVIVKDINNKIITDRSVSFSSADNSKATVNASGLVTAKATGNIAVTVTCESKQANAQFEIIQLPSRVNYTTFQGAVLNLQPWFGNHIVLLTQKSDLNLEVMEAIVKSLDDGYLQYKALTGKEPQKFAPTVINGRSTIASVNSTCGGACGYLGFTGIEMINPWVDELYNDVLKTGKYHTTFFYELGRNFWFYSDQLHFGNGYLVDVATGYSEAMKNIVTDLISLPIRNTETPVRNSLEGYAGLYKSDTTTNWKKIYESGIANLNGTPVSSHLIFASIILHFYKNSGRGSFVSAFFKETASRKKTLSAQDAVDNFAIALSAGTGKNLARILMEEYRFELSGPARIELFQRFGDPL